MYTYSEELISDLHKDARGYRPREVYMSMWNLMTPEEKQAEWEYLCQQVEEEEQYRREVEAEAIEKYESKLADLMANGAPDRETARRWLIDSLDLGEMDQEPGFVCYILGLPYSMEKEFKRGG